MQACLDWSVLTMTQFAAEKILIWVYVSVSELTGQIITRIRIIWRLCSFKPGELTLDEKERNGIFVQASMQRGVCAAFYDTKRCSQTSERDTRGQHNFRSETWLQNIYCLLLWISLTHWTEDSTQRKRNYTIVLCPFFYQNFGLFLA